MNHPLSQGVGYGVILGVGGAFALGMVATTYALRRYQKERITSEEFATAGRSTKSGLVACAIISSWTWTTTLLVSTQEAYINGISGALFYAAGGSTSCFLFAMMAMEVKRKAPACHTYLEIMKVRFGVAGHFVYMFFALAANIITMVELLQGGSNAVNYLTGMNEIACTFLLTLPVAIYTLFGGLKATFLTDYIHTIIMIITMLVLVFSLYTSNEYVGSPGKLYDLVKELAYSEPIEGNAGNSLLTVRSERGGIFLILVLVSAIPPVFCDQGYWNKAIAASPASVLPGYLMGGASWIAIPWGGATAFGLAARALEKTPAWPTWPQVMSADEVSKGLVLPEAATAILGKGGAAAALILVFMSTTSASSSEMVAASSIWTYDIFRTYINPGATGRTLIVMTHLGVIVFVFSMIGLSIGLYYSGVSLGFLFDLMGIITAPAVIPMALTLFWSGLNWYAALFSPILGLCSGIAAWMATTYGLYHEVTLVTSSMDYPMLAAELVSAGSPLVYVIIFQLIFGREHFDFDLLKSFGSVPAATAQSAADSSIGDSDESDIEKRAGTQSVNLAAADIELERAKERLFMEEEAYLEKHIKLARWTCFGFALIICVIFPMPLYGSRYVFSKPFFTGWVSVGIAWFLIALLLVGALPLWQSRESIYHVARCVYWDLSGQEHRVKAWQSNHPEALHPAITPAEILHAVSSAPGGIVESFDVKPSGLKP